MVVVAIITIVRIVTIRIRFVHDLQHTHHFMVLVTQNVTMPVVAPGLVKLDSDDGTSANKRIGVSWTNHNHVSKCVKIVFMVSIHESKLGNGSDFWRCSNFSHVSYSDLILDFINGISECVVVKDLKFNKVQMDGMRFNTSTERKGVVSQNTIVSLSFAIANSRSSLTIG